MLKKIDLFFKEKIGVNLDVRLKNPQYWFMLMMAVIIPITTYMGINTADITSWATLGDMFVEAVRNPYLLIMIVVNVYNATIDSTTKGFKDSPMTLNGKTSVDLQHEIEELREIIKNLKREEQ